MTTPKRKEWSTLVKGDVPKRKIIGWCECDNGHAWGATHTVASRAEPNPKKCPFCGEAYRRWINAEHIAKKLDIQA